jgi:mannose-6-phosphate isomerase-like protein (cupin superfamily)|tara:strand:+ start:460 stop:870 length:411 start_codon:yes stop_codon:yes gene_type:complete
MSDPYFKREYNLDVVDWTEAFLNYDKSVHLGNEIKFNYPGFFVSHEGHEIDKIKDVLKDLECNTAHLYFNISTKAETFGKHKDIMDVYYWQCQGVTKWIVEDKEVILNSGDLIYVPSGMYHSVSPLSPRLGISMSK